MVDFFFFLPALWWQGTGFTVSGFIQSCWTCSNKQMVYWDVDLCYNVRMNRELTFKVPLTVNSEFKAL